MRERLAQGVRPADAARPVHALPVGQEAAEGPRVGRLDLAAQRRQARAPQPPHHLGVAPLAARAAGPQLAAHQGALALEGGERRLERPGRERVARGRLGDVEGAARPRVARQQPGERSGHVLQEGVGQPGGRHHAEAVAVAPGVLGRDHALLAADPHHAGAALGDERLDQGRGPGRLHQPALDLGDGQVADAPQQVVQPVGAPRPGALGQALQVGLQGRRARRRRSGRAAPPGPAARAAGRG